MTADDLKKQRDREHEQRQFEKRLRESMALNELARQDAIQQRREAQNNQQERFVNNQGYKARLGGYRVQDGGSVRIMQSQTNSALPLGVNFADGNSMDAPPAFVFEPSVQPAVKPTSADYWFVYAIEFFDADGNITRTQFWVGGAANLLLAEYNAYGPLTSIAIPVNSGSESNDGITGTLTTGNTTSYTASGVSGDGDLNIFFEQSIVGFLAAGFYLLNYSVSGSGSGEGNGLGGGVDGEFFLFADASNFYAANASVSNITGDFSINAPSVSETIAASEFSFEARLSGANDVESLFNLTFTVLFSGTAQKTISPELLYASRVGTTMYVAIARHPADSTPNTSYPDDLQIDYFSVSATGQVSSMLLSDNSQIAEATTASSDWRKSLLELDSWNNGDFIEIPPSTEDECIDRFRRNALCNYQDNILKVLKVPGYNIMDYQEGDDTDAENIVDVLSSLLTSNGTFEIEEYLALSTADVCTLTLEQSSQRTAVQLSSPGLSAGEESKSTFFLWVTP